MPLIADRVELARRGANSAVICQMPFGWAVVGDRTEPPELRRMPAWFYDWAAAPRYDAETHTGLRDALQRALLGNAEGLVPGPPRAQIG